MPISQDRMLALIREATSITNHASGLREEVEAVLQRVRKGMPSSEGWAILETYLMMHPSPQPVQLLLEARHFQLNSRRNVRKRERERRRRLEAGLSLNPTAPAALAQLSPDDDEAIRQLFDQWNLGPEDGSGSELDLPQIEENLP